MRESEKLEARRAFGAVSFDTSRLKTISKPCNISVAGLLRMTTSFRFGTGKAEATLLYKNLFRRGCFLLASSFSLLASLRRGC